MADISNGDLRKGILILQNVKYRQFEMNGNPVTKIFIYDMCNFMTQETANKILKTLKMKESHNILVLMDIAKNISKQGFIFSSIMLNVINYVVEDDELLDDAIQFYSKEDQVAFTNLHRLLDHCKTDMLEMAKKQNFELISDLKEQSTIYKSNIETILRRSSFASGKTFTLTKDAVIVYVNKSVIDGKLFKKFFVINEG